MGIHGEVFKVHGALCSHREPGDIHMDVQREGRVGGKNGRGKTGIC